MWQGWSKDNPRAVSGPPTSLIWPAKYLAPGAQPALHFGGAIIMKFHSMTSSCLFNHGTTFSQTVTYNNNVFLPADTKSIVYKHTHSAHRWLMKTDKTERFTTALEGESPVSSEISDFTPYAHAQSNIQHIKYAEKTDD